MRGLSLAFFASLAMIASATAQDSTGVAGAATAPADGPVVTAEYSNPQLTPNHWTLSLRPDGSGHFQSVMGNVVEKSGQMRTPDIDRDVKLSPKFAASVFQTAQRHSFFNEQCESHMKVAYQGDKTLSYSGPNGKGSCSYNYSRDKDIQTLGENMNAVAETIVEGSRLEMLLQHDPLGLNKEMESLTDAAQSGRAQQLCVIRSILERLAEDDHVLDLVRKRAKSLLAWADN